MFINFLSPVTRNNLQSNFEQAQTKSWAPKGGEERGENGRKGWGEERRCKRGKWISGKARGNGK